MLASMVYEILDPADSESLRGAYEVYKEAIRPSERKAFGALRTMQARADYRFALARDGGGTNAVVGVAVLFVAADFGLMEYLAVAPDWRSGGVGSGLFRYGAGLAAGPVLVEVDLPEAAAAGAERAVCERRVAFYRRVGCRQLAGLTYRLPLPGDPPPMGLFLCAPEAVTAVPLGTVRRYVTTLYTRVYGQRADDPRIDAMLAGLPDPVRLI